MEPGHWAEAFFSYPFFHAFFTGSLLLIRIPTAGTGSTSALAVRNDSGVAEFIKEGRARHVRNAEVSDGQVSKAVKKMVIQTTKV